MAEHPYLKPLFKTQNDLLAYDCLLYLKNVTLPWLSEMKLKDSRIMGFLGAKLCKLMMEHFVGQDLIELDEEECKVQRTGKGIRSRLFDCISMLTEASSFDMYQHSQGVIKFT
jgi:hypothetical protein